MTSSAMIRQAEVDAAPILTKMEPKVPNLLVLGIGNVLWADEGFGVRCVEALHERFDFDSEDAITLMDGGTQGLYLVPYVAGRERVLVFDAVDFADEPGALRVVRDADVPSFFGTNTMSLHQVGFQDVLAATELLGQSPRSITLIGVQPLALDDYGGGLTDIVANSIDGALAIAIEELRRWGIAVVPPRPLEKKRRSSLLASSIVRDAYEGGRPSAEEACRTGDARFFPPPQKTG